MKKQIFFIALFLTHFVPILKSQDLKSTTNQIRFVINEVGKPTWISLNEEFNTYKVYCENKINEVWLVSDIDSTSYKISEYDTIEFNILVKDQIAKTRIVGVKELPNTISFKDKIFYLSKFWSEVKYNFINYDKLSIDWDSLYRETLSAVSKTDNDFEYYELLKVFACRLNDGHTSISDGGQFSSYMDYVPITISNIRDKIYLTGYIEEFRDQLVLGSEIVMVNGLSTKDYLNKFYFPQIAASTESNRWFRANAFTYGLKSEPLKISFKISTEDTTTVTFKRNGESTRYDRFGIDKHHRISIDSKRFKNLKLEFTNDSIAILEYLSFNKDSYTHEFENLLPQLYKAKGLIINLRNNGGGSTGVGQHLLQFLIKDYEYLSFGAEKKIHDAYYKAQGLGNEKYKDYFNSNAVKYIKPDTIHIDKNIRKIECPIAILVGNKTFSAAEDFLVMLYEIKDRPVLIGAETGGSTGAPLVLQNFPGGGYARICTVRIKYPYSEKDFVMQGIEPDIKVYPTIQDILDGNDVVLSKALEYIREKI